MNLTTLHAIWRQARRANSYYQHEYQPDLFEDLSDTTDYPHLVSEYEPERRRTIRYVLLRGVNVTGALTGEQMNFFDEDGRVMPAHHGDILSSIKAHELAHYNVVLPQPVQPPNKLKSLLRLISGERDEEAILGDLDEIYMAMAAESGKRHADRWYYKQTVRLMPFLLRRLAAKFKLFSKRIR